MCANSQKSHAKKPEKRIAPISGTVRSTTAAFAGRCSDVLVWETSDVGQYYEAVEALRDAGLLTRPWFEIVDVIPAIEDAWREHDPSLPLRMCAV